MVICFKRIRFYIDKILFLNNYQKYIIDNLYNKKYTNFKTTDKIYIEHSNLLDEYYININNEYILKTISSYKKYINHSVNILSYMRFNSFESAKHYINLIDSNIKIQNIKKT